MLELAWHTGCCCWIWTAEETQHLQFLVPRVMLSQSHWPWLGYWRPEATTLLPGKAQLQVSEVLVEVLEMVWLLQTHCSLIAPDAQVTLGIRFFLTNSSGKQHWQL